MKRLSWSDGDICKKLIGITIETSDWGYQSEAEADLLHSDSKIPATHLFLISMSFQTSRSAN